MTSAILIPWAETDWQAVGRFASRTPIAVNDRGRQQIAEWAPMIARFKPDAIHALDRGPGEQTAQLLAETLKVKIKKSGKLQEVALGLWEGLTAEELGKRFAKAYKQWKDDPSSICPPEGERLPQASERLIAEIKKIAAKHKNECFAVVLGPLAFAAVRCQLEGKPYEALWQLASDQPVRYVLNTEEDKPILAAEGTSMR